MGYRRLWRRNLCGTSGKCNEGGWGCNELVGGSCVKEFAMVRRTILGGEQFGWGAVSGGKEVHGLAFVKKMVANNIAK
jgi:hypothetical protein